MNELAQVANDGYNAVTSKVVRRTVIYTSLLWAAASLLYGIAVIGYIGFYHDYVPHQVRTTPVHLQYSLSPPGSPPQAPFGIADLTQLGLKTAQDYDVSVALSLPKNPSNLDVGNFMVELALVSRGSSSLRAIAAAAHLPPPTFLNDPVVLGKTGLSPTTASQKARSFLTSDNKRVLFAAARPALLDYTNPLVDKATRLLLLPLHLLAPASAESVRLVVPMAEALSFGSSVRGGESKRSLSSRSSDNSGGDLPAALYLELRTARELRTYGAEIVFEARLRGLRRLMYHHRVFSFVLMTTIFWSIEVLFMVLVFLAWGALFGSGVGVDDDDNSINAPSLPPPYQPSAKQRLIKAESESEDYDDTTEGGRTVKAETPGKSALLSSIPPHPGAGESSYSTEDSNDDVDLEKLDSEELLAAPTLAKDASTTTGISATPSSSGTARLRGIPSMKAIP